MLGCEKSFTAREIASLMRKLKLKAKRGSVVNKADYAIALFAYATGCRVGEIASISLDRQEANHLDLRSSSVNITSAKYGSAGTIPIDVASLRIIRWYIREVRPRFKNADCLHHLFITKTGRPYSANVLSQKFSLLLARFGFEGKTAHAFRHYFVSDLLSRGCQPHVVQALARHRDARTTLQVYAHPNLGDLRSAVNRRVG
jgi:integrase